MDFEEKAKIRIEHWMDHSEDHVKEYERFAEELENKGKIKTAQHIRAIASMTAKSHEHLKSAMRTLGQTE